MADLFSSPSDIAAEAAADTADTAEPSRRRPRPGERRAQILQALAQMLEQPGSERITTAALARQLQVSEAALYRHFASKAQMYEGLIDFIETSVFTLVRQITAQVEASGNDQAARIVAMLLQFAERNPGMVRVMAGDALVLEHERLQQRMNLFFDKLEAQLRQCLRPMGEGEAAESAQQAKQAQQQAQVRANVLACFALGRLQRFARSDFKRLPTEQLQASLAALL